MIRAEVVVGAREWGGFERGMGGENWLEKGAAVENCLTVSGGILCGV
jgi:hypothetical protein